MTLMEDGLSNANSMARVLALYPDEAPQAIALVRKLHSCLINDWSLNHCPHSARTPKPDAFS
jgi:hypothetical protein